MQYARDGHQITNFSGHLDFCFEKKISLLTCRKGVDRSDSTVLCAAVFIAVLGTSRHADVVESDAKP